MKVDDRLAVGVTPFPHLKCDPPNFCLVLLGGHRRDSNPGFERIPLGKRVWNQDGDELRTP